MISQLVGPVEAAIVHRVAGTGDLLPGPDHENTSPEQVERPRDQTHSKAKARQKWSRKMNMEVMYCYYMATKERQLGYRKRLHEIWQQRGNEEKTEQRLCDRKKHIIDKTLLTEAELQTVKEHVDNECQEEHQNITELYDQPTEKTPGDTGGRFGRGRVHTFTPVYQ